MGDTDKRDLVERLQIPIDPHNEETVIPAWCVELMDEAATRILSDAKKIEAADQMSERIRWFLDDDEVGNGWHYVEEALEAYRAKGGE